MKNTNKDKIDSMAKARSYKKFQEYREEARGRIVLATEIYKARTKKGLSQQELAKKIHTTQKVISKIENGEVNLGIDLLYKMTNYLKIGVRVGNSRL